MLKKIISFMITFSMLFSVVALSTAQSIALPSNYTYLSKEAKTEVLKNLISQLQDRINQIIAQRQKNSIQNLPFSTRVVLNNIEKIGSDMTESGKMNFLLALSGESKIGSMEKFNFKIKLDDINYKTSVKGYDETDLHMDGKYSVSVYSKNKVYDYSNANFPEMPDFNATEKDLEKFEKEIKSQMDSLKYRMQEVELEVLEDSFSVDFITKKDKIFVKINGFKKLLKNSPELITDFIKNTTGEDISEDELGDLKDKIRLSAKIVSTTFMDKWVEIPLPKKEIYLSAPNVPGLSELPENYNGPLYNNTTNPEIETLEIRQKIDNDTAINLAVDELVNKIKKSLKKAYLKNQFLSLTKLNETSFASKSSEMHATKINFNMFSSFIKDIIIIGSEEFGEEIPQKDLEELDQIISQAMLFLKNELVLKTKLSIDKDEQIDGVDSFASLSVNKNTLLKYIPIEEESSNAFDFDFDFKIDSKKEIWYYGEIRDVRNASSVEELQILALLQIREMQEFAKYIPPQLKSFVEQISSRELIPKIKFLNKIKF